MSRNNYKGAIILNQEYRIVSDERNITIEKKMIKPDRNGNDVWIGKYFYKDLASALRGYRAHCQKTIISSCGEIKIDQAIEVMNGFEKSFEAQINGLKIKQLESQLKQTKGFSE